MLLFKKTNNRKEEYEFEEGTQFKKKNRLVSPIRFITCVQNKWVQSRERIEFRNLNVLNLPIMKEHPFKHFFCFLLTKIEMGAAYKIKISKTSKR